MKIKSPADASGALDASIVTVGVDLPVGETVAEVVIPSPPGGGSWRWTGAEWEDLNPKPVAELSDSPNPTATE